MCIPYYLITEFNLNTYMYEDFNLWVPITDINQEGIYEYESSLFSKIVMSFDKKKLVNKYNNVFVVNHPLCCHNLSIIRNKATNAEVFRNAIRRITYLLFYKATEDLELEDVNIETPLEKCQSKMLKADKEIIIAPILRAGLIFSDIEALERRITKISKQAKQGDKQAQHELEILEQVNDHLASGKPARTFKLDEKDKNILHDSFLITEKPVIYLCNISQEQLNNIENDSMIQTVKQIASNENAQVVEVCAQVEEELASLSDDELEEFKMEFGIKQLGLPKLINASYSLLGLISFLTAGEKEVRAWTIKKGTKAPQAAGVIHTDFERGFIKAEVVKYEDLVASGNFNNAKEQGKVRMEGKDYVVCDGDVMLFRFNV